jgi:hypothetical protein
MPTFKMAKSGSNGRRCELQFFAGTCDGYDRRPRAADAPKAELLTSSNGNQDALHLK